MTEMKRPSWRPMSDAERKAAIAAMRCDELVELVTDYLEGMLEPDEQARLEWHLAACDGCDFYIEQFRHTIAATGRLEPEAVPDEAVERLLEVYRRYKRA